MSGWLPGWPEVGRGAKRGHICLDPLTYWQECDRPNSAYMLFYEREGQEAGEQLAAAVAAEAAAPSTVPVAAAAAGEEPADTLMLTPQASAAARAAGPADAPETASEPQPMAVSPAPEPQAPAAAQQPAVAQAQQTGAAAVQAPSGLPYGMPAHLHDTVQTNNLRQLGTMQLLSVRPAAGSRACRPRCPQTKPELGLLWRVSECQASC